MRDRSGIEKLITYVTFLALSLAIHVAVILGNRPLAGPTDAASQASAK